MQKARMMPVHHWTLNDIPAEYRIDGGLWDTANVALFGTNQGSERLTCPPESPSL